ncbi:tRNA threonylcarbamoyladenosine dehydratase [Fusarium oxysporum f. sp. albedinis]|nr:tRNA threonylcarbamoyladenosine dehydratase [Fusarium oxysporum f. sp. albedinis]
MDNKQAGFFWTCFQLGFAQQSTCILHSLVLLASSTMLIPPVTHVPERRVPRSPKLHKVRGSTEVKAQQGSLLTSFLFAPEK